MHQNQSSQAADPFEFVRAEPDEITPVKPFPSLSSLPPDLLPDPGAPTDLSPPPNVDETKMQFEEIIRLLDANNRSALENNKLTEKMCAALLDEGGTLDTMTKSLRSELQTAVSNQNSKIDQIRSEMAAKFDDLIDKVTVDRSRVERLSESAIRAELPFTCLVVDDDAELRGEIEKVLNASGIAVLLAQDAEDALSLLRGEAPIDVVLADINLHGRGAQFVKSVRADHSRVEVVITTGSHGREASEALDSGAYAFVAKPFPSNDHLRLAVIRAAEYRRQRSASAPRA
ncbi:MAG TPA: response regulator [Lacunisphaera sp.]|nr:response regulator [Lacunisphaera sp.]